MKKMGSQDRNNSPFRLPSP